MQIDIQFRGIVATQSLRDHIHHEVHCHLSRFGKDVTEVVVRVGDITGPMGVDKLCQITVKGPRIASATREDLGTDACAAVDLAASRVAYAVGRELERARRRRFHVSAMRRAS